MLRLFVVDGQGGQTVQIKARRVTRHVLVVALRRDHCAVVAAEFQFRQVDLGPQLLGTVIDQLAQTAIGRDAARQTDLLCAGVGGGDLTIDNVSIVATGTVTVTSFTITQPANA